MCTEPLDSSRLYGLIGESARLLPESVCASLEVMLGRQEKLEARLEAAAGCVLPCVANRSAVDARDALGWQEREALGAILEILHSAQQERGEGFGDALDDRLVEGLLVAGRLIIESREVAVASG